MLYNLQSWLSAFSEYSNYFVFSVSQEMMFTSEKKDWEKLIITPQQQKHCCLHHKLARNCLISNYSRVFFLSSQIGLLSVISSSGRLRLRLRRNVKIPTKLSLLKLQDQIKEPCHFVSQNLILLHFAPLVSHTGVPGWL